MKCRFCGYCHGWIWVEDNYTEVIGEHGQFWIIGNLKRQDQLYEDESGFAVMCPVPECQRTQIEN